MNDSTKTELQTTLHRVKCPWLGDTPPPPATAPCGCPIVDLLTLVPAEVFAPWEQGCWAPDRRAAALLERALKVGGVANTLEFLLASSTKIPVEVRGAVLQRMMMAPGAVRIDPAASALLTAALFPPR